ncbi:amino acid adenylation domain-containing protein [Actinocrinis puniceicyclus]|uniref:Amino acid adenylation domain-containing protein n=1 Tax=Actinocrinis puniceicyclus TaxID=977794 RepID=A0A8J7WST7_9ACTN|nr:non-ribosomal peptide synthetase [Actinocrinis puniceicyclus]MBS2965025.1 amino acid adenylation domain-containing protein [Actinocrinis puniceicyclus]
MQTDRREATIPQMFRRAAAARPWAVAVEHGAERITYGELDRISDAVAADLARLGVGRGCFVPIRLPRSVRLVASILGVLKSGAAYALIDGAWPDERVRDEIGQLGARVFVTEAPPPPGTEVRTWLPAVDSAPARGEAGHVFAPPTQLIEPGDPCCVFFTSGTTGRPKGAVCPHRAVVRLLDPGTFAPFGAETVMPLAAAQPWDLFSLELFAPLLSGGRLVVVDGPYLSADLVPRLVRENGLNTAFFTTSLFNMLVDEDPACFKGLSTVMTGGERLSPPHVRAFLTTHPDILLVNGYGPVEATVFASARQIIAEDCDVEGGIPIGVPVPRTRLYVLDEGLRPVPEGELGELCIAGDGLAVEYLGNPELTAQKFPSVQIGGVVERVYRTGDLALRDAEGVHHYRGRIDRQVKVRGHRVEPLEVECVIGRLPAVASCVVVPRLDAGGACAGLLAFYVETPGAESDPDALVARLRTLLAGYQIPERLVRVERFPLMPNGKLDAAALLALLPEDSGGEAVDGREGASDLDDGAPLSPFETTVTAVTASVVGRAARHLSPTVTFTALGATSLDLGRICARLGDALGRPVPVSQIYRAATARALAAWIEQSDAASEIGAAPPQEAEAEAGAAAGPGAQPRHDAAVPLSPMQTYMLLDHLFDPDDRALHCVFAWRVEGRLDRAALRHAVGYLHRRHRILGASFRLSDRPVAVPGDGPAPALREALAATERDALRVLSRELGQPFRLEKGEVWRPVFVAVRDAPVTLVGLAIHHIASDGGSAAALGEDLALAYNAYRAGAQPEQPPAPGPAAVAAARQEHLRYVDLDAQREYWRGSLVGLDALTFPGDASGSGDEFAAAGMIEVPLGPETVRAVARRAARESVSPFCVYVSAYAQALAELTGRTGFGIGTPVARRGHTALAHAVNCLIDIVCLRAAVTPDQSPAEAIAAMAPVVAGAFAAQDVSIYEVYQLTGAGTHGGERPPLFQNMFVLQDNAPSGLVFDGMPARYFRPPYPSVPSEIVTEIWPTPDAGALLIVGHRPQRASAAFCRKLADRFAERLAAGAPAEE